VIFFLLVVLPNSIAETSDAYIKIAGVIQCVHNLSILSTCTKLQNKTKLQILFEDVKGEIVVTNLPRSTKHYQ